MSGFRGSRDDQSNAQGVKIQNGMKKKDSLTQERVKELFDYDQTTGHLLRRVYIKGGGCVGSIVGCKNGAGYYQVCVDQKLYLVHRIIWLWNFGYFPEYFIDHKNGDKLCNTLDNLREVTPSCNMRNYKLPSDNNSGVKGVCWSTKDKCWIAAVRLNRKHNHLHMSKDFVEAVAHRLAAEECLDWSKCEDTSTAYQYMQKYIKELNETRN